MKANLDKLYIENADVRFLNFSGNPSRFNENGNREFVVFIHDIEEAERLRELGWNVRIRESADSDLPPIGTLRVKVSYKYTPPKVIMITSEQKVLLNEDNVGVLDSADIENVDLVLSPSRWEVNGNTGVKAYLHAAYVTLEEDRFSRKYSDIPYGD